MTELNASLLDTEYDDINVLFPGMDAFAQLVVWCMWDVGMEGKEP